MPNNMQANQSSVTGVINNLLQTNTLTNNNNFLNNPYQTNTNNNPQNIMHSHYQNNPFNTNQQSNQINTSIQTNPFNTNQQNNNLVMQNQNQNYNYEKYFDIKISALILGILVLFKYNLHVVYTPSQIATSIIYLLNLYKNTKDSTNYFNDIYSLTSYKLYNLELCIIDIELIYICLVNEGIYNIIYKYCNNFNL
jgi:hypothetical protein